MNRTGRADEIAPTPTDISVVVHSPNVIGESPIWCPTTEQLYLVDISGEKIHILRPADGNYRTFRPAGLGYIAVDARHRGLC